MNGLYFNCKNGDYVQIAHEWSMDEIVYVDHIHNPWINCWCHGYITFVTTCWVQLDYVTNGKISYMNNLQLDFSCKYGFSTNGSKKFGDKNL